MLNSGRRRPHRVAGRRCARYTSGSVAPSVPNTRTVLSRPEREPLARIGVGAARAAIRQGPRPRIRRPPPDRRHRGLRQAAACSRRRHSSSMVMKASAPTSRIRHARIDTSPHASPAMMVSSAPSAGVGLAGDGAAIEAIGVVRLDHDEARPRGAEALPQIRAHAGRQAADAALHEHVRRNDAGSAPMPRRPSGCSPASRRAARRCSPRRTCRRRRASLAPPASAAARRTASSKVPATRRTSAPYAAMARQRPSLTVSCT